MKKIISNTLKEISDYLEFKSENVFKVRAYREASRIIENFPEEINTFSDLEKLKKISGIGESILSRISEILTEGRSLYLDKLKEEYPSLELEDLISIPGLGIKKVRLLYDTLGVKNIEDLKDVIYSGKILELRGIGKKVVEKIKKGIEFRERNRGFPFPSAFDILKSIFSLLNRIFALIYLTGELRRKKEFVRSFDFVVLSKDRINLSDYMNITQEEDTPYFKKVFFRFENISGIIYVTSKEFLWHTLFYSTGSWGHVRAVLNKYKSMGFSFWNQRFNNEGEIYKKIDLPVFPPIVREDRGEFDWYPSFSMISKKDIKGELHVHSLWSDGKATISQILDKASELGYSYIGISDHSASLNVAGGLSIEEVYKKEKEILDLRDKNPQAYPLFGAEVDIKQDGTLDYPDTILKRFDYVIGAIHTNFGLSFEENTKRIISALRNPYVIAFAHPTGRELGIRPGYEFDREEVFKEAERNGVLLEINGTPRRMDLDSYELSKLRDSTLRFLLSSDAHYLSSLSNIKNSVIIVDKAGIPASKIVNTYDLKELLELFNNIRKKKNEQTY